MKYLVTIMSAALVAITLSAPAMAADEHSVHLVIKDHRFTPSEITVPAGKRVELIIENQDATPEEFESEDLRREKIVVGHGKISVWIGPLPAGTYGFYGEYHKKTAQGKVTAK